MLPYQRHFLEIQHRLPFPHASRPPGCHLKQASRFRFQLQTMASAPRSIQNGIAGEETASNSIPSPKYIPQSRQRNACTTSTPPDQSSPIPLISTFPAQSQTSCPPKYRSENGHPQQKSPPTPHAQPPFSVAMVWALTSKRLNPSRRVG